jgi:HK97 family phage major capsid protein
VPGWWPRGQPIPYDQPTFAPVKLGAYKVGWLTQASFELINDGGVDIMAELAQQNGVVLGQKTGPMLASGASGSGPTGLITGLAAAATGASGTGGAPTADQLIDLMFTLPDGYLSDGSCGWLMHRNTLATVRKLKAAGTGEYLFTPDRVAGSRARGSIFGYPVFTDPWMPKGTGARSVVFGAFSNFYVRQVGGFRWEQSVDFAFDKDVTTFRGLVRLDSAVVDNRAFVSFQGGT